MGDSGETASAPSVPSVVVSAADLSCTICLATRFNTECRVNGCSHSFCFACISEWVCQSMRPSCPMCRHEIDKVFYGFEKEGPGRMKIFILEYRSMYSSLSMHDKSQLIGERRVIVRNMMHAHKTMGNIKTALSEQATGNEELTASLNELMSSISQHVEKAEVLLENLRTEAVRKNRALVFANPSFRKMLYTVQIRVKYADYGRASETRADLARDPERLRKTVNDFLMAEFDVIPLHLQPRINGIGWRTKFLGSSVTAEEKAKFAEDIYNLMLAKNTGNASFQYLQAELLTIFPQIGTENAQLLDDHLEALVAINQTDLNEFYNAVYYDSVFNNSASGLMDIGFSASMRDERPDRFEIIFRHMQRDAGLLDWEFNEGRFRRQTSNTNGTDRATNNDDSSRSASPEERVPTPMPDDEGGRRERAPTRVMTLFERMMDPSWTETPEANEMRDLTRMFNERAGEQQQQPPMRREDYLEEMQLAHQSRISRYRDRAARERQLDAMFSDSGRVVSNSNSTSRTIPFLDAHRAAMRHSREMEALTQQQRIRSLRPTARREQVLSAATRVAEQRAARLAQRPVTRRDNNLDERVRQFEQRSIGMAIFQNILRSIRDPTQRIGVRIPLGAQNSNSLVPVYMPEPRVIEAVPRPVSIVTTNPTTTTTIDTTANSDLPPAPQTPPAANAPVDIQRPLYPRYQDVDEDMIRSMEQDINEAFAELPPSVRANAQVIFPNPALLSRLTRTHPRRSVLRPLDDQVMAYLRSVFDPRAATSSSSSSTDSAVTSSEVAPPPSSESPPQEAVSSEPAAAPEASDDVPPATSEPVSSQSETPATEEVTQEDVTPSLARRTRAARRATSTASASSPATKRRRGN